MLARQLGKVGAGVLGQLHRAGDGGVVGVVAVRLLVERPDVAVGDPRHRMGRHSRDRTTRSGSVGVRTGTALVVMPKLSNQSRTSGAERRWRMED